MANVVHVSTGRYQPKWLEGFLREKFFESLEGHSCILATLGKLVERGAIALSRSFLPTNRSPQDSAGVRGTVPERREEEGIETQCIHKLANRAARLIEHFRPTWDRRISWR